MKELLPGPGYELIARAVGAEGGVGSGRLGLDVRSRRCSPRGIGEMS